jgi:L-malate glycosyltransferase
MKVLLSTQPLPAKTIGSWVWMISKVMNPKDGFFDLVVAPSSEDGGASEKHHFVPKEIGLSNQLLIALYTKLGLSNLALRLRFRGFTGRLGCELERRERLVLAIIDDYKLLNAVDSYLRKKRLRNRARIIFFIHGYDYGFDLNTRNEFYKRIDHFVVLSRSSYLHHLNSVLSLECSTSILRNGVDENLFRKANDHERRKIREELGWGDEQRYFLWLSVNRPKKGLHVIRKAWKQVSAKHPHLKLVIIGADAEGFGANCISLGPLPNQELPKYYQATDFYLFPSLWHEGHPLALTEALRCGATCLSSEAEPLPEIMGFGKYGRLVEVPHDPKSWVLAIEEELEKFESNGGRNPYAENIPDELYTFSEWKKGLEEILKSDSQSFEK